MDDAVVPVVVNVEVATSDANDDPVATENELCDDETMETAPSADDYHEVVAKFGKAVKVIEN